MRKLDQLSPQNLWRYFEDICQIPRPSNKEEKIIRYLLNFAIEHQLEAKKDNAGNVVIKKPATPGMEKVKPVILQSHVDMVCEKNADTVHNFETDAIKPLINGDWVTAEGTTLGADNGMGMAAQLAILESSDIPHGPLECLFTVGEEAGLTGAFGLEPDFLDSGILINLDSEDEGELFIGCAGGRDTKAVFTYQPEEVPEGHFGIELGVKGLLGGHSGDDINKGRGNAIKILARFIQQASQSFDLRLAYFEGGNLRNAIPREAVAIITVPSKHKEHITVAYNIFRADIENELKITEPKLKLTLASAQLPSKVVDKPSQISFIDSLMACPHGVIAMSYRMPGMVETSSNLSSVKFNKDHQIIVETSQRSDLETGIDLACAMTASVFRLANAEVSHSNGYPGWTPNPDSEILKISKNVYEQLFKEKPIVRSIHAGLECGIILKKYPGMDMVSFGPTIKEVHSPDEKINIETVQKFWKYLLEVLKNIPEA